MASSPLRQAELPSANVCATARALATVAAAVERNLQGKPLCLPHLSSAEGSGEADIESRIHRSPGKNNNNNKLGIVVGKDEENENAEREVFLLSPKGAQDAHAGIRIRHGLAPLFAPLRFLTGSLLNLPLPQSLSHRLRRLLRWLGVLPAVFVCFDKAGFHHFRVGSLSDRGCPEGGWVGWMGSGGSVCMWNPGKELAFAYVPTGMESDVLNHR